MAKATKKVTRKKASTRASGDERLQKLRDQVAALKEENKALKQAGRTKDRQIAALLKALESVEQRVARFLKREQKELISKYEVLLKKPRRRRARKAPPTGD